MSVISYAIFDSSLGNILFVSRDNALIRLIITHDDPSIIKNRFLMEEPDGIEHVKPFLNIARQLDLYIKGEKIEFHVPVDLSDLPQWTRKVLMEVKKIPYGEVKTYNWIAKKLGYKNGARAVGQALKINPIPIIIPCHRVIRQDGSIGGFSLGVQLKKRLLSMEGMEF
ncbi:MAG TPA: methylated-DNA--[protein]-cysteine S-methyltransferase [Syntrophorhabdaceae bacterium]|nr:methylated-DNA--[protein]-cysteine S-methyltransferase [Syntrophorhabdaceae bacterium]HOT41390.1 methylated-DNA--[protein]-cysteine S-methyltransferase [Syntrophorhabdaceae bacterium]HQE80952.1 methylated-DNA--[protein]-cysteine S-methyltransferase [Syntrophorhabdaceae bacterium]HQH43980.1 methylated-DNA--[protein]-cysteine S-methyltransferase [Syntrophorhabdaceae bacterium]HQK46868.1 methylated-DNA--[protein]-cysteine S-methyltransferase [Syntrophorhabdaceae bacterium]